MHKSLSQVLVATFVALSGIAPLWADTPRVHIESRPGRPEVHVLSWDTEGGRRAETNLLRAGQPLGVRVKIDGQWKQGIACSVRAEPAAAKSTAYRLSLTPTASLLWSCSPAADSLTMTFALQGQGTSQVQAVGIHFPFDPGVTPVTVLPGHWADDGSLRLPAVISAPDFGQMLLAAHGQRRLKGRLEGSRAKKTVDFFVELPALQVGEECVLSLTPVRLPAPRGLTDQALWEKRGGAGLGPSSRAPSGASRTGPSVPRRASWPTT